MPKLEVVQDDFRQRISKALGTPDWSLFRLEASDWWYSPSFIGFVLAKSPIPNLVKGGPDDPFPDLDNVCAMFYMTQLPGCCGVMVSHGSSVFTAFQKKGLGTILNDFRKTLARNFGYTILLCTDKVTNIPSRKLLEKNGWKDLLQFRNNRTGNRVALSMVNLREDSELEITREYGVEDNDE